MADNIENKETLTEAAVSSTAATQDDKQSKADSSTAEDVSLLDAMKDVIAEKVAESSTEGEEKVAETVETKEASTDEGEETKTEEKSEEVPFHKHLRWIEVQEKLKAAEVEAAYTRTLNEYRQRFAINDEQFNAAVELLALINTNPAEAKKKLEPIVAQLSEFDDSHMPSDLQKKVADGLIDEETAKEVAALRARNKLAETRGNSTGKAFQREREQAAQRAVDAWEQSKRTSDPDYARKLPFVLDRFNRIVAETRASTPEQYVAAAERSYEQVTKEIEAVMPKKATAKSPNASAASVNGKQREPQTLLEVAQQVVARKRV